MAAARYGALLEALRGVQWPARRVVPGTMTGTHRARARGVSSEFTEYRAYRQGDDPRRLDWRLLARSDRAYIRLSTEHAQLRTMIIADASASMAFPVNGQGKWEHCRRLVVGLAGVSHADGDPVGCVVVAERGDARAEPRSRRGVVGEIARLVDAVRPAGSREIAPAVAMERPSPRLVILSDLLGDLVQTLAAIRTHIAIGGEVHVVHIVADEEINPPRGIVTAVDPEASAVRRPLVDSTRAAYDRAFADWRTTTASACRASGASYTETVTSDAADRVVRRIAMGERAVSLLAPGFLVVAALAIVGLFVAHLFSRSRPREAVLPTARFVPDGRALAPTRARVPTDLLLLLLRTLVIALVGLAFARPVLDGDRDDVARVLLVDESWHSAGDDEQRGAITDSVRTVYRDGDVVVAFDTAARMVSAESLHLAASGSDGATARGSLSVALVAGMREGARLARGADSIELVLVSPVAREALDSATLAIRETWPGRIRVVRTPGTNRQEAPRSVPIEVRAATDDPLRGAVALLGGVADIEVRITREPATAADSAWARQTGRVLVAWHERRADIGDVGAPRIDSVGAVIAGGRVVVAAFERLSAPAAGRTIARWVDGEPATSEVAHGDGCIRSVGIPIPAASDVALQPEFGLLLRELLGPCGGARTTTPATDAFVARLAGAGPLAPASVLRVDAEPEARWIVVLLAGAILLAVVEMLVRRRTGQATSDRRSELSGGRADVAGAIRTGG